MKHSPLTSSLRALAAGVLLLASPECQANTIIDTISIWDGNASLSTAWSNTYGSWSGQRFVVPTGDTLLQTARFAMQTPNVTSDKAKAKILRWDTANNIPFSTVLWEVEYDLVNTAAGVFHNYDFAPGVNLLAGAEYIFLFDAFNVAADARYFGAGRFGLVHTTVYPQGRIAYPGPGSDAVFPGCPPGYNCSAGWWGIANSTAFRMTFDAPQNGAVPEPATWMTLAAPLAWLVMRRIRSNR